ncbi:MAG: hypothetical protein WBG19_04540 [Thermoplasmata archaeon]
MEEGIPFCPHCSAPQIRVIVPEPAPAPAVSADPLVTPQGSTPLPGSPPLPEAAFSLRWSNALQPCLLAALVATVLMVLGLNPFVAMLSVGFLAVIFYRQRRPGTMVKAQAGAKLGALSGLLWYGMASILEVVIVGVLHKGSEIKTELMSRINQAATQTSDPQALAMFDRLKTPGGLEFLMLFGLVFALFAAIILAGLGGALGGAIFGRRDKT